MRRLLALALVIVSAAAAAGADETLALRLSMQVIAADPEMSSRQFTNWAEDAGGYFTFRSLERVILRVPPDRIGEIREISEASGNTIVSYNPSATDYREELARNDAAIRSRNEALDRILAYLDESNVTATLSFERELRSLLQEVEYYSGRNRRIRNEIDFAVVEVYLSSRQRTIPEQRPSTFAWVNTVDLYSFLREAQP